MCRSKNNNDKLVVDDNINNNMFVDNIIDYIFENKS